MFPCNDGLVDPSLLETKYFFENEIEQFVTSPVVASKLISATHVLQYGERHRPRMIRVWLIAALGHIQVPTRKNRDTHRLRQTSMTCATYRIALDFAFCYFDEYAENGMCIFIGKKLILLQCTWPSMTFFACFDKSTHCLLGACHVLL